MKLKQYAQIELAAYVNRGEVTRLGVALIFIALIMIITGTVFGDTPQSTLLVASAVIGAYMAMNIGANDVANNVGPAVGSAALTLAGAIAIAAIFEAAGALIAGGDVVSTVKRGIIDPGDMADSQVFVWAMMAALLGGAIWLNLATALGAPVSTTHSIVGGVMGGRYRRPGLGRGELGQHDQDRVELGDLADHGRADCGRLSVCPEAAWSSSRPTLSPPPNRSYRWSFR